MSWLLSAHVRTAVRYRLPLIEKSVYACSPSTVATHSRVLNLPLLMLTLLSTSVFPNKGLNRVTVMTLCSSWVAFTCWEHLRAKDYRLLTKDWQDYWATPQLSLTATIENLFRNSLQGGHSFTGNVLKALIVGLNNILSFLSHNCRVEILYFSKVPGSLEPWEFFLPSWNKEKTFSHTHILLRGPIKGVFMAQLSDRPTQVCIYAHTVRLRAFLQ